MGPRLRLTAAICCPFILAACSSGSGASPSGSAADQLARALLPVTPVQGSSPAVQAVLEPGAPLVLDAVGPDGAKYHAEFPRGAALAPVTVTMQPLQGVGGLRGKVEGVVFQPSGLMLARPAVLTIDGPVADARAAQAFGYQDAGGGTVARPVITASGDGPLRLIVGHFSGYGASSDAPPQWNIGTISAGEARDIIALEDFVIAGTHRHLRNHDLTEAEAAQTINNALDGIAAASKRLGEAALAAAQKGNVSAAAQTEIAAALAVILASTRADELLGHPVNEDALQVAAAIMKTYLVGVTKRCEQAHDVTVLNLLLLLSRQAQLLGEDDPAATEGVQRCASATVRFRTTITERFAPSLLPPGGDFTGDAQIDVSASINLFDGLPSKDVTYPVVSTLAVDLGGGCTVRQPIDGSTFSVRRLTLKQPANPPVPPPPSSPAPRFAPVAPLEFTDATVELSLGRPQVQTVPEGPCGPGDTAPIPLTVWFDQLHPKETKGAGVYLFDSGYEIPGGGSATLARRTIDRFVRLDSVGTNVYNSHTVIEIIHNPG
jgi:hypothetical protein